MYELFPIEQEIMDNYDFLKAVPSSANLPIPVNLQIDVGKAVDAIAKAYSSVEIAREEQRTERERIRKFTELATIQLQEKTKRYVFKVSGKLNERMEFIKIIKELSLNRKIDNDTIKLVGMFLNYLSEDEKKLDYCEAEFS